MSETLYPIKIASKKSGLNVHTIRAWEKRYQLLSPARTETNRRLYNEKDIEKLILLQKATNEGHPIGSLITLSTAELQKMVSENASLKGPVFQLVETNAVFDKQENQEQWKPLLSLDTYKISCIDAIRNLNSREFELLLNRALISLGKQKLIEALIIPFIEEIGYLWEIGDLRIGHEHLASSVLRTFLGGMINNIDLSDSAPLLISTTPSRQIHELGALIVSVIASIEGWRVIYLGPNLPAEEIIDACIRNDPRILCLSFVYPCDDLRIEKEMKQLSKFLPSSVKIIAGGQATKNYSKILKEIQAICLTDVNEFRQKLQEIRNNDF